jgi:hypothetical protein
MRAQVRRRLRSISVDGGGAESISRSPSDCAQILPVHEETTMATKRSGSKKGGAKRYGAKASKKVSRAMHEMKSGTLRSGRSGKKVTSRKQAIAIGLSEARKEGGKVPSKKRSSKKRSSKKRSR